MAGVRRLVGMDRTALGRPRRPEIGELNLEALDLEPQGSATRERKGNNAGGRIGFAEFDSEQVEHVVLAVRVDAAALAAGDTLEAQSRSATAQLRSLALG
jgi:hypothetical protein